MKMFKTTEKTEVKNYPYGYLRTSAFFSLEFKPNKGFRSVFQTINPKTGRINKPKYSTYAPLMIMKEDNGFVSYIGGSFNGAEAINKDSRTVFENFDLFTPAEIKHFYQFIFMMLKVEAQVIVTYCGADFEKVKPVLQPAVDVCIEGIKNGGNLFDKIIIDIDLLNSCRIEGFNPFRVVTYENVTQNKLNNPVVEKISDHDKRAGETIETVQAGENVKVLLNQTLGYYEVKQ